MAGIERPEMPQEPRGTPGIETAEIADLRAAIEKNPEDARAMFRLGNLLENAGRQEEAIAWWEKAAKLEREFPGVWRNLGRAYYNVLHDKLAAKGAYQRALQNSLIREGGHRAESASGGESQNPGLPSGAPLGSARILYERDQLWKRLKETPEARLAELELYPELLRERDELTVEYCALLNQLGRAEEALALMRERHFAPGEEDAGLVMEQWTRAQLALGRKKLWLSPGDGGSATAALGHFEAGLNPPANLGGTGNVRAKWELHYWAGMAARACAGGTHAQRPFVPVGRSERENPALPCGAPLAHFETAVVGVSVKAYTEDSYWAGVALKELGRHSEARQHFEAMLEYAEGLNTAPMKSEPAARPQRAELFAEDTQAEQKRQAILIEALARHGLNGGQGADRKTARRLLNDLLAENPSDARAADLMLALDWGMG